MTTAQKIQYAVARATIGIASFLIGWVGAAVLIAFVMYNASELWELQVVSSVVMVISIGLGGLIGALPFGHLGLYWIDNQAAKIRRNH